MDHNCGWNCFTIDVPWIVNRGECRHYTIRCCFGEEHWWSKVIANDFNIYFKKIVIYIVLYNILEAIVWFVYTNSYTMGNCKKPSNYFVEPGLNIQESANHSWKRNSLLKCFNSIYLEKYGRKMTLLVQPTKIRRKNYW